MSNLTIGAKGGLARRLPLLALVLAAGAAWVFFGDSVNFDALAANQAWLLETRDAHFALTALSFVLIYICVVATSLPGSTILTLAGGFLFGLFPGVVFNVIAATTGAALVFLAARMGFGRDVAERMASQGGTLGGLQKALRENDWSVLLTMRLIPVIPFFVANLVPAFVGIRFGVFVITTAVGILPAALIFTSLGAGLGAFFARGEAPSLGILLQPQFALPLVGLSLLALLPAMIKIWRRMRG